MRSDFEERKTAKIQRYEDLAEKNSSASTRLFEHAHLFLKSPQNSSA
jgi:hypothetical protein